MSEARTVSDDLPPGFVLQPRAGDASSSDLPPGFVLQSRAEKQEEGSGGLAGIWDGLVSGIKRMGAGMTGEDVSRAGRFGMGVADPVYGGAQIGARMMAQPGGGVPEQAGAPPGPDLTKQVDTTVQQRETGYQQREKAAGLDGGLGTEWARIVGNVVGTAPLAAIGGAATIPGRIASAAAGGALGSATMPVAGGNFEVEKAKQAGLGAAGGAVLGGAAEGLGAAARGLGRQMLPPRPAPTAQSPMPSDVARQVQQQFQRAAPMSKSGISDAGDIAKLQAQRQQSVQNIVAEKPNLIFDTTEGEVAGKLPQTRGQLAEAYDQVMNKLFQKWDAMTEKTGATTAPGTTSDINKFREAFGAASSKMAAASETLDRAKLKLEAELRSPGGEETGSIRTATQELHKAEDRLKAAESERVVASREMQKPWIDLKPIASELETFASAPSLKITPRSEGVIKYAQQQAAKYADVEAASPRDAQKAITNANNALKTFYKNPSYETAASAAVDAMIANNMRKGLDDVISKVTGPGYQDLKNQYGAMAASQKDVISAAVRAMGNTPEARFLDSLINVSSAEELVRGIVSMHADPIMRGLFVRGARMLQRYMNNPDRQVRMMFQNAERGMMGRGGTGAFRAPMTGAAGLAGGEGAEDRIRPRGPTSTYRYRGGLGRDQNPELIGTPVGR